MGPFVASRAAAILGIVALLSLPGCGGAPERITGAPPTASRAIVPGDEAPAELSGGGRDHLRTPFPRSAFRYPLVPGRTTRYEVFFRVGALAGGEPDFGPWYSYGWTRTLTCEESRSGHEYLAERWTHSGGQSSWLLLREDRRGLHEADVILYTPPACELGTTGAGATRAEDRAREARTWLERSRTALAADPGRARNAAAWQAAWSRHLERTARVLESVARNPLPATRQFPQPSAGELLRLAYPLRLWMTWVIRDEPRFGATVERIEAVDLAVGRRLGARVRLTSELYGPDDEVFAWYGTDGLLRLYARTFSDVMDEYGNVIGRYVSEYDERLTGIEAAALP